MKRNLIIAAIMMAFTMIFPMIAQAGDHTEFTPNTAIRMDDNVAKIFPSVASPCGEACFVIKTSNPRYGEIILFLNDARLDGTAVDVETEDTCWEYNTGCAVVKFVSPR